jgi:Flp pilus assembly protein TadG
MKDRGLGRTNRLDGRRSRLANERGQALLETALTLPLVLLVAVSIFEFGRAYQTSQVLTNAVREGARVAVLPDADPADVQARVRDYMRGGQLGAANTATVTVNRASTMSIGATTASASVVTVSYPFSFIVLNPVARLVTRSSGLGGAPLTMTASAQMRNEAQ